MADPVPSDEYMTEMRDSGHFVCQCRLPQPDRIPLFRTWQCARCYKPLSHPPARMPI